MKTKVDLAVTIVQVVLTAVQAGGMFTGTAVAVEPPDIEIHERLTIEEYVRWSCGGDAETTTVRAGRTPPASRFVLERFQLSVCRLKEDDGERMLDCRTADFGQGVRGMTQRDAVGRVIEDCLERG